jgi:hypothetical protein
MIKPTNNQQQFQCMCIITITVTPYVKRTSICNPQFEVI